MTLEITWFVIIAVFWTGFLMLEGFDFGIGILHKVVGRTEEERRLVVSTVGPTWDGNEVWLIVGVAAIFAAFPDWYATWLSAGYLAIFLVLMALIIRGVSFEWRAKVDSPGWLRTFSWMLTIGSAGIPLILGIALGDLLAGLPIDSSGEFTGGPLDLLTPYGVLLGVTLVALCVLHGATFLTLKTDGVVRGRSHALAAALSWVAAVLVVAYAAWTLTLAEPNALRVVAVAVPVVGVLAAIILLRGRREGRAFAATSVTIGGTIAALFVNLYPAVMVSSTDAANTLTVEGTASSTYALQVMTVVALVMTPVVLAYQAWSFWVFRGRLRAPTPENVTTP